MDIELKITCLLDYLGQGFYWLGSGFLLDTLVRLFSLATMVALLREALVKPCIATLD